RIVTGEERRGIDTVHAPRLLPELFAADATLGRMDVDLVGGGNQPPELALGAARIVLDRAELGGQPIVLLRRVSRRRVRTVALHRDLTRREVRALSLVGEPRPPLGKLGLTLARLGEALRQVAPDLVEARKLPTERLDALGCGGEIHAARRQLGAKRRLVRLCALDRRSHSRGCRLDRLFGVARDRDPL